MIKFFHKIRQQLITDNKVAKYLLYAIGEIALVMIGILLALQVNNWNEGRKLQKEEVNLLADIQANLRSTYTDFNNDLLYNDSTITFYSSIEFYIENDLPYEVKLDTAFGALTFWASPTITNASYQTLQNKGLDLIKNEAIKQDIVRVYEVNLMSMINDYDKSEWSMNDAVLRPYVAKHIRRLHTSSLYLARPNDFESLKQSEEFKNILSMLIRQRKRGREFFIGTMMELKSLIDKIEQELITRNYYL